ncbi:MAG: hypothetical protein V7752_03380 [Halopseudomonas sp.]
MKTECRGTGRVQVVWKATLTRLNGEQLPGSTDNVSADGVNVIIAKPLVLGEPVRIDIVTPCRHGTCYFKLEGVAVYSHSLDNNLGNAIGLRLLKPTGSYLGLVQSLDVIEGVA